MMSGRLAGLLLAIALAGVAHAEVLKTGGPQGARAQASADEILVMLRAPPQHLRPNSSYGGAYGDTLASKAERRVAEQVARRNRMALVADGWPMPLLGLDCYVMQPSTHEAADAAVARVSRDPLVAWSEPMHLYHADAAPRGGADPLLAAEPAEKLWRLAELHRAVTGRGEVVAVVDSKIDVDHPDLAGQFVAEEDFVGGRPSPPERHGTGVAGVIAAKAGNGVGIVGVAPGARLMALRACWQAGEAAAAPTYCDSLSLAKALDFAIGHHANIINLSLSGPPDRLLAQLIDIALGRGVSVVAAYDPSLPKGGFPASEPKVIAVANESLPSFPPGVYGAPGDDVLTTQPGGKWFLVNGSSFAAAHVSGLVALVREEHQIPPRPMLVASQPGRGVVDACATLFRSRPCACACPQTAQIGHAGR